MPDISSAYGNAALAAPVVPTTTYYLSLHYTDPLTNGTNEVTDASYARQPITFNAPSGNVQTSTNGQTYSLTSAIAGNLWFGIWTAVSGASYLIGDPNAAVTGPVPSSATVTFNVAAITITAN